MIGTITTKTSSTSCIDTFNLRAYYTINGAIIRLRTNQITNCLGLVLSDDMIISGTLLISDGEEIKQF